MHLTPEQWKAVEELMVFMADIIVSAFAIVVVALTTILVVVGLLGWLLTWFA